MEGLLRGVHKFAVHKIKEYLSYKSVLRALIIKQLYGKYKNTVLGFAWHFFTPLMMILVYYVVFSEFRGNDIQNYWAYLASGLFCFSFMLSGLISSPSIIIENAGIIKKMYLPRELLVVAQTISNFIVLCIATVVFLIILGASGCELHASLLLLPLLYGLMFLFVLGYALLLSSITVYYRDIQYILSTISIVFYFITPLYFTVESLTNTLSKIVYLNPFTYYVELSHQLIYYGVTPFDGDSLMCIVLPIITLTVGAFVFGKLNKRFAEKI